MRKRLLLCVLPYLLLASDNAPNNTKGQLRKRMERGEHRLLTPQEKEEVAAQLAALRTQGGDLGGLASNDDPYGEGLRKRHK